jgi:hypothetical protein
VVAFHRVVCKTRILTVSVGSMWASKMVCVMTNHFCNWRHIRKYVSGSCIEVFVLLGVWVLYPDCHLHVGHTHFKQWNLLCNLSFGNIWIWFCGNTMLLQQLELKGQLQLLSAAITTLAVAIPSLHALSPGKNYHCHKPRPLSSSFFQCQQFSQCIEGCRIMGVFFLSLSICHIRIVKLGVIFGP